MIQIKDSSQLEIKNINQLEEWLHKNYDQINKVWLITYSHKVLSNYIAKPEIQEKLIKYGWVAGARWKLDDQKALQLINKRTIQPWTNEQKIIANHLIYNNQLHANGKKVIYDSIKNGLWDNQFQNELALIR